MPRLLSVLSLLCFLHTGTSLASWTHSILDFRSYVPAANMTGNATLSFTVMDPSSVERWSSYCRTSWNRDSPPHMSEDDTSIDCVNPHFSFSIQYGDAANMNISIQHNYWQCDHDAPVEVLTTYAKGSLTEQNITCTSTPGGETQCLSDNAKMLELPIYMESSPWVPLPTVCPYLG